MSEILKTVATFVIEGLSSIGIEAGTTYLSDIASIRSLQKADDSVREYLAAHVSEFEYDKLDSFLANAGIYSYDQSTENNAALEALTEQIIADFYAAHLQLRTNRASLTLELKKLIRSIYKSTLKQLSLDCRILYNQAIKHDAKTHQDHEKVLSGIDEINSRMIDLRAAMGILSQNRKRHLSVDEVKQIYTLIIKAIDEGSFALLDSIQALMEEQVCDSDRYYLSAIRIHISYYLYTSEELIRSCYQFAVDNPSEIIALETASFLMRVEQTQGLSIILPLVKDTLFSNLAERIITKNIHDIFQLLIQEDHEISEKYRSLEYALWAIGNTALSGRNYVTAHQMFSAIEQSHPSFWVQWRKCLALSQIALSAATINPSKETEKRVCITTEKLFSFRSIFDQLNECLLSEFVNNALACAEVLSPDAFSLFWNMLTPRMIKLPCAKKQWYAAHIAEWKEIDPKELEDFCKAEGCQSLWNMYLLHRALEDAPYVMETLQDRFELFEKDFTAVLAYARALTLNKGADFALRSVKEMALPDEFALNQAVLLAQTSDFGNLENTDFYISVALDKALEPGNRIFLPPIKFLSNLLLKANRWSDAEILLEKYQEFDPELKMKRLGVLLLHKEKSDVCIDLISQLHDVYPEDARLSYCQGVLEERSVPGAGCDSFERAYHICPSVENAYSTLASRLNRHKPKDDDILTYVIIDFEVKLMVFPDIVKIARQKTGMSQEDLARALNVSFATINRWENGKTRPNKLTQTVFFDYCKKQGLDIENLKGMEESTWR